MKFGLFLPTFADSSEKGNPGFAPNYSTLNWEKTIEYVKNAEKLGFDSIWVPDHLIMGKNNQILDSLTILGALAPITQKIRLGTVVLCSAFRHPAILAKMISTIDFISNGRMEVGLGSGWHKREFEAFNFPDIDRSRTREIARILQMLWEENNEKPINFTGDFYTLTQAVSKPTPTQRPIPFYIGGNSDESLKIVADIANGWLTSGSISFCSERFSQIRKFLDTSEKQQRVQNFIWFGPAVLQSSNHEATTSGTFGGSISDFIKQIQSYERTGFTELIFAFPDFPKPSMAEAFIDDVKPEF
ncbi:MAG: LLM class flavin-dependent oxidoreductase [Candidatus Hodarchaeales archaeon]|jgi:alkanesulfonate monooxygenase SsuD/methylene tetrahydromethanopterin reductase-like flavin-dependent oxidoreductase (luciferase family)